MFTGSRPPAQPSPAADRFYATRPESRLCARWTDRMDQRPFRQPRDLARAQRGIGTNPGDSSERASNRPFTVVIRRTLPGVRQPAWRSSGHFIMECPPGKFECGEPKPMNVSPAVAPGWSADSRTVYFSSQRSGGWRVWKRDLAGGTPVQVTHTMGYAPHE